MFVSLTPVGPTSIDRSGIRFSGIVYGFPFGAVILGKDSPENAISTYAAGAQDEYYVFPMYIAVDFFIFILVFTIYIVIIQRIIPLYFRK